MLNTLIMVVWHLTLSVSYAIPYWFTPSYEKSWIHPCVTLIFSFTKGPTISLLRGEGGGLGDFWSSRIFF